MYCRQTNIEILRIILIVGIIVLHCCNPSIGGALKYVEQGSINFYVLHILVSTFACGVNCFMLITGYFSADNYKIIKPYLLRTQEKIEKNEVYDCIAAAKLRFVSLISKYNPSNEGCDRENHRCNR